MRPILYAAAILICAGGSLPAFAQAPPPPADATAPPDAAPPDAAPPEAAHAKPMHHHRAHHRHPAHHHAVAASTRAPDPQKEAQDHLTTPTPK